MADASPSMWATLVPVVVGGVIALAGGWLGPWLLERRKERTEHRLRRADKFEELVSAVYEFDHWIDDQRSSLAYGEKIVSAVSPFHKMQALSSVYFPQFEKAIGELDAAAAGYRVWMTNAGQKRLEGKLQEMNTGFQPAYSNYAAKRDALVDALKSFARAEFQ